jgi:hypothetical protein
MRMKTLRFFEKSGTTRSSTQHNVPVDLNLYQRKIFGLKSTDPILYKHVPQIRTPAIVMTNARYGCPEIGFRKCSSKYVCRLLYMAVKEEAVEYF